MKKRWLLTTLVLTCCMQSAWAAPEEMYDLGGIVVTDVRDTGILPGGYADTNASIGFLGSQNVMNVPFSQTNYTAKMLDTFGGPGQPVDTVLQTNPSIRAAGSVWHSDFTFRGFRSNGTSMFLNGIPGMFTQFNMPTYFTDRVEITSGPAGGIAGTGTQYESDASGGIINFVSKRAPGEDVRRLTTFFTGHSNVGGQIDLSHRFGDKKEMGVRVNAEWINGETSIKNQNYNTSSVYVNFDRQTDKSKTNLLAGYRDLRIQNGHRWFKIDKTYDSDTLLPAPKGDSDFGFPGNYKSTEGYIIALNHEQTLNDQWTVFLNAGMNRNNLSANVTGKNSAFSIVNKAGDYPLIIMDGLNRMHAYYLGMGARAHFTSGDVKHEVVIMTDWSSRKRGNVWPGTGFKDKNIGNANIYTGIIGTPLTYTTNPKEMRIGAQRMWGISVVDTMEVDKWQVILGGHYHKATNSSISMGKVTKTLTTSGFSPTFGLVYRPNKEVSVYANHSEYFNEGEIVGTGYTNAGQVFKPVKTKQNEIGVKYQKDGLLTTLSLFEITKNSKRFMHMNGPDKPMTQFMDGQVRHRGVELNMNGRLTNKWTIFGGLLYMDAKHVRDQQVILNGKKESAQPDWTGTIGIAYEPNDQWNMFLRGVYTGKSIIRVQGDLSRELTVPAHTVFDLGARFKTALAGHDATFGLTVYNLFDKDYWMASRGDQIYASLPRTLMLSAQFNF